MRKPEDIAKSALEKQFGAEELVNLAWSEEAREAAAEARKNKSSGVSAQMRTAHGQSSATIHLKDAGLKVSKSEDYGKNATVYSKDHSQKEVIDKLSKDGWQKTDKKSNAWGGEHTSVWEHPTKRGELHIHQPPTPGASTFIEHRKFVK